ncbi:MAG: hypothetical protein ACRBN8_29530 [Nannocystales bacterium]
MHPDPLGLIGATMGARYDVLTCLAVHGARVIYKAQHREWGRPVRLEAFAGGAEQQRKAFVDAGGAIAELGTRFSAIAQVRDGGVHAGPGGPVAFVVSEWVDGPPLADAIVSSGRTRFAPEQVLEWMDPVLDAVVAAHREGVVHGHFDPDAFWVMGTLGPRASFKIDGLVEGAWRPKLQAGSMPSRVPSTGFAAPELASGDTTLLGPWTDVYGLAAVMSVLLCGSSSAAMRDRALPPGVKYAFDKALNPRIDARFKTLAAFRATMMEGMAQTLEGKSRPNPRRTMVVADVESQMAEGSAGGFEVSDDDGQVEVPRPSRSKARVRLAYTQPAMSVPDAIANLDAQRPPLPPTGPQPVAPPKKSSGNFVALLAVLLVVAVGGGVIVGYMLFR